MKVTCSYCRGSLVYAGSGYWALKFPDADEAKAPALCPGNPDRPEAGHRPERLP
jgi:hypothetical protein